MGRSRPGNDAFRVIYIFFFFFTADEGSSTNAILLIAGKIIVNIFCG